MNSTIKDTLEKTQWFAHSIDKVWKAITETEQVSKWLVPTDFKAEVGSSYTLKNPKDDCNMVTGKVLEADPYKLVYSWINETCKEVVTLITWNLVEEKLKGLPARIVQHEYDHLDGTLITDHLNPMRRRLLHGKLRDIGLGKVSSDYRMRYPQSRK